MTERIAIEWMFKHYILSFILMIVFMSLTVQIINRMIRSVNILFQGWPPSHLDADGDWKENKENDEDDEDLYTT